MITVKDLMTSDDSTSPDGRHWEPLLWTQDTALRHRLRDAWAVFTGKAVAIQQTPKEPN